MGQRSHGIIAQTDWLFVDGFMMNRLTVAERPPHRDDGAQPGIAVLSRRYFHL